LYYLFIISHELVFFEFEYLFYSSMDLFLYFCLYNSFLFDESNLNDDSQLFINFEFIKLSI
jgi:hypothetical protein